MDSKVKVDGEGEKERRRWSNPTEFLLSCIGYAVGLNNVWRFPYLCMRNGGGAFLVPYFLFLFVFGIPLALLEISIGQYGSASVVTAWKICPLLKGVGWCMVIINMFGVIYFPVLMAWLLYFVYSSFRRDLPWMNCENEWNTDACLSRFQAPNMTNITSSNETNVYNYNLTNGGGFYNVTNGRGFYDIQSDNGSFGGNLTSMKYVSPSEEFWHHNVLEISDGVDQPGALRWPLVICHLIAWATLALILWKGIRSVGKVVYVTVTLPYVFLTVLLVRGCTLPGSLEGILFYIMPDMKKLAEPRIWAEAALQIFYTLGAGWGGLMNFASHNKFHNNVVRDTLIISLVNCGTSFYGGFAIFSVIGYMAQKVNLPVDEVITSGPGLAFVAYPEALGTLPFPQAWSVLFFLMLLTLTLDSQFGSVECLLGGLRDAFSHILTTKRRHRVMTVTFFIFHCLAGFIFYTRAGIYYFQIWDWYLAAVSCPFVVCAEVVVVSWIYGINRFTEDITSMIGKWPGVMFKAAWAVIDPILMGVLMLYVCITFTTPSYGDYVYPVWANAFGWIVAIVSLVPVPIVIILKLSQSRGSLKEVSIASVCQSNILRYSPSESGYSSCCSAHAELPGELRTQLPITDVICDRDCRPTNLQTPPQCRNAS